MSEERVSCGGNIYLPKCSLSFLLSPTDEPPKMQFDYELLYPDENAAVEMAYPVPAAGAGFGGGGAGGHGSQWPNVAVLSAVLLVALAANFLALPVILFR